MDVLADRLVRGQQAVVRIKARGLGVIVSGAEVAIAAQHLVLAAHDHDELCVRLETEDTVHHVRARLLQLGRDVDVRLFVESGAQFDDHGDVLARERRVRERPDDARIAARSIQRLLDREHLRIRGRLLDEVHDGRKALKRMVQQHVARAQRGEHIAARAQALRDARHERRVFELGPVDEIVNRHQPVQVHRPVHAVKVVRGERELIQEIGEDLLRDNRARSRAAPRRRSGATPIRLPRRAAGRRLLPVRRTGRCCA